MYEDFAITIGGRIKAKREALGLSRNEVAKICGMSYSTVQRVEDGKSNARVSTLVALAVVLDMSNADLYKD